MSDCLSLERIDEILSPLNVRVNMMHEMTWKEAIVFWCKLDTTHVKATEILAEKLRTIFPNKVVFDAHSEELFRIVLSSLGVKEQSIFRICEKLKGKHTANFSDIDRVKITEIRRLAHNIRVKIMSKIAKISAHLFGNIGSFNSMIEGKR